MLTRDKKRLEKIMEYCDDVTETVDRLGTYEDYLADKVFRNAVCMCILQIGELANSLSNETTQATAEQIPWHMIRGFRNRIAHDYANMKREVEWFIATEQIPILRQFCSDCLIREPLD
jgi:uncharacterized protein with HEPN domain